MKIFTLGFQYFYEIMLILWSKIDFWLIFKVEINIINYYIYSTLYFVGWSSYFGDC